MKDSPELTSRYELGTVLSWQGSTRTYEARDPAGGDTLAVKIISLGTVPEAQVLKQRFLATAAVLRTLDHPNLPRLQDFGVTPDGEAFLVFDWIEGTTLDRLGELAPRQVLPYVLQAIEGLECLALHGLVHLNLTPENLMVTPEGEIKLLGLGASLFRVDWQSPLALGGMTAGTGIAAPELQVSMAAGSALWRADLYALAFVTCALLDAEVDGAGTAFPEVRFPEHVARQLHAPDQLADALARCLHIDPGHRPVSYSNLGKVLQHSLPRAPRADGVVRDTQVFEVGRLADREAPRVPPPPVEDRLPEPRDEPSTEMVTLRSDLEASLGEGELKQPSDLGREAEIYEGFLEIREESAPVEIDLGPHETPEPADAGGDAQSGQETVLVPEMSRGAARERRSASPVRPETGEPAGLPRPQSPRSEGAVARPRGEARSAPPSSPSEAPPPRPEPPPHDSAEAPRPPGSGRAAPGARPDSPASDDRARRPAVPAGLSSKPQPGASEAKPTRTPAPLPSPRAKAAGAPSSSGRPGAPAARPPAARPPAKAPAARGGAAQRPGPGTPRPSSPPVAAPGHTPAPRAGASAAAPTRAARSRSRRPAEVLLEGLAGAARAAGRRSRALDRRVVLAAAGVGLITVSSLAAVLFWPASPGASTEPPIVAEPSTATPEPPPAPERASAPRAELPPALAEAVALLDAGELLEARKRLDEVARLEEEGSLDEASLEAYRAVEEIVARQRSERLEEELQAALRNGNVSRLRQTLAGMTGSEDELLSASSSGRLVLADALRARSLLDAFDEALADGDRLASLDAAFRLAEAFPRFDSALRARERATAAVEGEVDRLIGEGRLEDAEEHLTLLKSMWPERPGIDGKLETVRSRLESEARFDTVLAAARAAGGRGRPHEGLRLLEGVQPKREYVDRFARQQAALSRQLAELDAEAPTVRLPGGDLEFKKGEPAVVELEAKDDYLVAKVTFWARNHRQNDYTELTAKRVEEGLYRVEIAPSFHGDKTVRFWATARDLSGNEGRLGSSESPVEIKRDRWFR